MGNKRSGVDHHHVTVWGTMEAKKGESHGACGKRNITEGGRKFDILKIRGAGKKKKRGMNVHRGEEKKKAGLHQGLLKARLRSQGL